MHRLIAIGLTAMVMATLAACGGKIVPNEIFAASSGVEIQGEGFDIREGRPVPLPFVLSSQKIEDDMDIVESYSEFRRNGAREVSVKVPGRSEPLHGLLSLHELPDKARGPATRSFSVKIPPSYVDAATDGRISVVFEPVRAEGENYFGWILWMSDRPF